MTVNVVRIFECDKCGQRETEIARNATSYRYLKFTDVSDNLLREIMLCPHCLSDILRELDDTIGETFNLPREIGIETDHV